MGDQQGIADSFNNLGNGYDALGQHENAIAAYQQSLALKRVMGDRQGVAHSLYNLGSAYSVINRFDDAEMALRQSLEAFDSIRYDLGDNDANKVSFFEQQMGAYQKLQIVLTATDRAEAALEVADRARARSLAEFLAEDQPKAPTSLDLDGIRQVIREQNATAIIYSDLGGILYTWVVRPDGHITLRHEQSADETVYDTMLHARSSATNPNADGRGAVASDLGQWSANLRSTIARDRAVVSLSRDDLSNTGETGLGDAYQRLIAPIADLLPTDPGARLIIVPDRELGLIPWAALRDPASDRRLIDRYTLTLAPSLQTLRETHRRRQNLPPGGPPLIVGNPAPMPNGLDPLPHAEREAIAIAQRHHITPLVGAAATETAVKQTWQTARWLHFATHGDPGWIALRRDRTNDGLLTSEEIFNSHLQAELVVMSACDTGRGNVTGEGILSLARAFLRAGTPSVIATLWQVPDDATAFLMDIFYRELAAGASKAAALRTAQLETRAQPQYAHPRNWAAFILIGEAN
ncbi:MAG: CHAT domain-containing protein [Cyanobacteria bacterium]|nr:CHAT domain-containing protein [Cyanobacteriota bacterium]